VAADATAARVPRSLVWATDLDVLPPDRVVDRRDGYLVVRSPGNPGHYWGNLLIFDDAPAAGDGERWEAAFRAALGADPDRGVILEERRGDGRGQRKDLATGDVEQDAVAERHPLGLLTVAGLEPHEVEATLARDLVVLGAHHDHPVATGHGRLPGAHAQRAASERTTSTSLFPI